MKPGFFDLIIKFILFAFVVLSGIMKKEKIERKTNKQIINIEIYNGIFFIT